MQVSVPLIDKIGSVDTVLLLDRKGATLSSLPLNNLGGRRKSLFKAYISIPTSVSFTIFIFLKHEENRNCAVDRYSALDS